jgi:arylsulfatase A-like enzyme
LDAEGWLDEALVLFVGDHGEAFFEHGEQTHAHHLYAEEVDVPGLFWAKNLLPGRTQVPVSGYDLAPTLLRLLGQPTPAAWTGRPIQELPVSAYRFASALARQGLVVSVTSDTHRMQVYLRDGRVVVTDHQNDPAERNNLYNPEHPTTQALWSRVRPHVWGAVQAVEGTSTPIVWPEGLPR